MSAAMFEAMQVRHRSAVLAIGILLAAVMFLLAPGRAGGASVGAPVPTSACPLGSGPGGHNYQGASLTLCNFSGQDLSNADFQNAKLTGVVFVRSKLAGANFSNATILDSGNTNFPTDFSFADLSNAKFVATNFNGPTYLTYATLTCADFSQTNLNNGNAIFGDQPLSVAANANCRTLFKATTMNCEFVPQWKLFDLTNAIVTACASQLQTVTGSAPYDFSGGKFSGVVFDNLDLTGTTWNGAVLEGTSFQGATLDNASGLAGTASVQSRMSAAKFNKASVQNVDLSNAQLYGAQFINANLSNSSLSGAFLSSNTNPIPPAPRVETAAKFDGAHLRNVDLSNAKLQGASFTYASLYGSSGSAPGTSCTTTGCKGPRTGFTCACAKASNATLTNTNFSNAYLFGVDFNNATVNGTNFGSAILTGATFTGATFQANGGAPPDFGSALLQGTRFDSDANLVGTNMLNAFVDFSVPPNSQSGNILSLQLSANYTGFRGWQGAATPCVNAPYATSSIPPPNASMTCPNGNSAVCGAGKTPASIGYWQSAIAMAANTPVPGWYFYNSTYDKMNLNGACTAVSQDPNW